MPEPVAVRLLEALRRSGGSIAVAESLTGGLVTSTLVDVPGASAVLRGGIVAYATELKASLLGVDAALLAERGPVDPVVAEAMAQGVRSRTGATFGMATTGVAGPLPQHGHPVGEFFVAVVGPDGAWVRRHQVAGDRAAVRRAAVLAALGLAAEAVSAS